MALLLEAAGPLGLGSAEHSRTSGWHLQRTGSWTPVRGPQSLVQHQCLAQREWLLVVEGWAEGIFGWGACKQCPECGEDRVINGGLRANLAHSPLLA